MECHENWFQTSDLRPLELKKNIYIVNSSQFLSPNVLWSRNVQRQPNIYLLWLKT